MIDNPAFLERTPDDQFHGLLHIATTNWKLYELDSSYDLLVVTSLKDPLLNRASSMLSLSWLGHLKSVIPISIDQENPSGKVFVDTYEVRDRAWVQRRTDPIPLTFTKFNGSLVVSEFHGEWVETFLAEELLGKFLFEEIKNISENAFKKMTSLVPDLTMTQFNFGFDQSQNLTLIGCPGHLINSYYKRSFVLNFLDFWMTP